MADLRSHREWWPLTLALIAGVVFSVFMIAQGDFLANVGFLVLGALIAVLTVLLGDTVKRPAQARDLAAGLFQELADRVARCCFDCERPWHAYLDADNCTPGVMDSFRLRKFAPIAPIIYPSTANQLALLGRDTPQAVIQFYYRLAAWERDIENIAAESQHNKGGVAPDSVRLLAIRAHQTLAPGLRALEALTPLVEGHEQIEANAIAGYDETRTRDPIKETLRDRIRKLLGEKS